jgi:hypothetical protein
VADRAAATQARVGLAYAGDELLGGITLAQLKARPVGKKEYHHRSNLHDDITVVILDLRPASVRRRPAALHELRTTAKIACGLVRAGWAAGPRRHRRHRRRRGHGH